MSSAVTRCTGALWLLHGAVLAQLPPPSPAALAEAAQPLRVVCVASSAEALVHDEILRERVLARLPTALQLPAAPDAATRLRPLVVPLGRKFIVPLGSGFVVDPDRRHVVTAWQVVSACIGSGARGRQLGVIEAEGADIALQLAERLPDRTFQDASGKPVQLVQAVCIDRQADCGAELPRAAEDKPLAEPLHRRQLDNLRAYAPDLAVLRVALPLRAAPLALALNQQLDDQMRLVARSFGPLPVGVGAADAAARLHLVEPQSVAAVYTGPQQISSLPRGGQPGEEIHAKLHRLAAAVQPGQSGAPVLRGSGVVGVLTAVLAPTPPATAAHPPASPSAEPAYAVPVSVLAVFLDLLKVPYVTAALELPQRLPVADAVPDAAPSAVPAAAGRASRTDPQRLMLVGAAVLAVLAALAFVLLARRRQAPLPLAPQRPVQPGQRTTTRINPTLLHAVAMPTEALEPSTPPAPQDEPPPPAPGVHLHCSAGPLAPAVFSLPMPNGGNTLYVGRDPQSCQLVFPAGMDLVSAVHACLAWDPLLRVLSLRDLSSSGTWVNGQRVDKGHTLTLAHGDQVGLGGPEDNCFRIDVAVAKAASATESVK